MLYVVATLPLIKMLELVFRHIMILIRLFNGAECSAPILVTVCEVSQIKIKVLLLVRIGLM